MPFGTTVSDALKSYSLEHPRARLWASGVSTAGLAILGVVPHGDKWSWGLAPVVVGVVLLAGAGFVGAALGAFRERNLREVAEYAAREAALNVTEGIEPVLQGLEQLYGADGKPAVATAAERVRTAVLHTLSAIVGPDHSRSCYFKLNEDASALVPYQYAGRTDEPRTQFVAGTTAGDAALAMVMDRDYRYVSDVDADPPPGWPNGTSVDKAYRSFIAVDVCFLNRPLGMLTVDNPEPNSLTEAADLPTVRVLAKILGIAEHFSEGVGAR